MYDNQSTGVFNVSYVAEETEKKAVSYEDSFVGLLLMVTFRPKLARSSNKALVAANSSEFTDSAFCMLVWADVLGQTSGSSVCVCFWLRCLRCTVDFLTWRRCQRCTFRTVKLLLTDFILSGVRMTPRQTLRYGGPPGSSPLKVQNTKIILTEASILTNAGVTSLIVTCKGAPIIESRGRGRLSAPLFV
jgi:hypothetical protein